MTCPDENDFLGFVESTLDAVARDRFVAHVDECGSCLALLADLSVTSGETAAAIAYIQIKHADGKTRWGAGVDTNIELASVHAVLSALNRS